MIRGVVKEPSLVALAARTTRTVEEARRRHSASPVATAALGRLLTASALLAATLKGEESVTLRVVGEGPLGGIIAEGRAGGAVRGYLENPAADIPPSGGKLQVGKAVGKGFLYVTRDMGLKEPYTGSAPLVNGEIATDLSYYLAHSEQTPAAVALGVLVEPGESDTRNGYRVRAAGGLLVQALPGAFELDKLDLEKLSAHLAQMQTVSRLIETGKAPEEIILEALEVLPGSPLWLSPPQPVAYRCRCSRARLLEALITVDLGEVEEGETLEARCHFCGRVYRVQAGDLKKGFTQHA